MRRAGPLFIALVLACAAGPGCRSGAAPAPRPITFAKDIAPILYANCAPCHRPGEAAPFTLLTYADAVKHADGIAEETAKRHMPPWLPDASDFAIVGERRLRDEQIAAIQQWVASGKTDGDLRDLPPSPSWPEGWQSGRPDAVLTVPQPYHAAASPDDIYRNVVLRTSNDADAFVRAVEFRTGGAPVHHAVIRVDSTHASRRRDGEDGQPGFDGMAWGSIQDPDGQFIGWAPGRGPILSPEGMAWRLPRGADLVVELHLLPTKKPVDVRPSVALFFTDRPPARTPVTVRMGSKTIDIQPGQRDYLVTDTYEFPVSVQLLSVYPHAHYLGTEMTITAKLPDGSARSLLHIPRWNFHWQQDYRYASPVSLPRGTAVTMRYVYDNSDANQENPHHPPVRVQAGPRSVDEMAELGLQLLPESAADAAELLDAFDRRDRLANVAMGEMRVRSDPGNPENQLLLGSSYVEVERYTEAIPHLQTAVARNARSADAHNYLGTALMAAGRVREALPHLQRAAQLAPRSEVLQFNLGNALRDLARFDQAAAAYQRAMALNPEFPDAHVNMGTLLLALRRPADAVPHLQRAVDLRPDSAVLQNDLGGALAAAGRYGDAIPHVRRALEIDPDYAPALDNLKRLQQMGIR